MTYHCRQNDDRAIPFLHQHEAGHFALRHVCLDGASGSRQRLKWRSDAAALFDLSPC